MHLQFRSCDWVRMVSAQSWTPKRGQTIDGIGYGHIHSANNRQRMGHGAWRTSHFTVSVQIVRLYIALRHVLWVPNSRIPQHLMYIIAYQGLYYFLDVDGWSPTQLEWNMKLWWPHNEAMIALLMAYQFTKDAVYMQKFEQVFHYCYTHVSVIP